MTDLTQAEKPHLTIDMVADPVCPWCYVGKRALDRALMALSFSHAVAVRFRPFQLAPDLPRKSIARRAYLEKKFPDATQREQMGAALVGAAKATGLVLDPALPDRQPNTLHALRLLRWSHIEDKQLEVVEAIFAAYWQQGQDIGEPAVLAQIAQTCGLDRKVILARLESEEDVTDISHEVAGFRAGGVTSVPTYIVNEQAGFSGALPPEQLLSTLQQLSAETQQVTA